MQLSSVQEKVPYICHIHLMASAGNVFVAEERAVVPVGDLHKACDRCIPREILWWVLKYGRTSKIE